MLASILFSEMYLNPNQRDSLRFTIYSCQKLFFIMFKVDLFLLFKEKQLIYLLFIFRAERTSHFIRKYLHFSTKNWSDFHLPVTSGNKCFTWYYTVYAAPLTSGNKCFTWYYTVYAAPLTFGNKCFTWYYTVQVKHLLPEVRGAAYTV